MSVNRGGRNALAIRWPIVSIHAQLRAHMLDADVIACSVVKNPRAGRGNMFCLPQRIAAASPRKGGGHAATFPVPRGFACNAKGLQGTNCMQTRCER